MLRKGCHTKFSSLLMCLRLKNIVWASGKGGWKEMNKRMEEAEMRGMKEAKKKKKEIVWWGSRNGGTEWRVLANVSLYLWWEKRAGNPLSWFFPSLVKVTKLWLKAKLSEVPRAAPVHLSPCGCSCLYLVPGLDVGFSPWDHGGLALLSTGTLHALCQVQVNFILSDFYSWLPN